MSETTDNSEIARIADATGFGEDAVKSMADAIRSGNGSLAPFNHPDLGGFGQWSLGGMLMIGDMFNDALKAGVGSLADMVASSFSGGRLIARTPNNGAPGTGRNGEWWPDGLGQPSSCGAQNGLRYAVFPDVSRLAIETGGKVALRDTGDHRISGVSQQRGGASTLRFDSQIGFVEASEFPDVDNRPVADKRSGDENANQAGQARPDYSQPPVARPQTSGSERTRHAGEEADPIRRDGDPLDLLRRLAELKGDGILSEEEFTAQKAELLAHL